MPSPSTSRTDSCGARPRITIASCPVSFPAIANWLEASASVSIPVSGDLATTANFALVVSGVPTSGENTNASGAVASRAPAPGVPRPVQQPGAEAGAADVGAQDLIGQRQGRTRPGGCVHDKRLPEVAAGGHVSRPRRRTGRRQCHPPRAESHRPW